MPAHGNAGQAVREQRRKFSQSLLGALAAGEPVGDKANAVPALDLRAGKVGDVPEQPTNRGAEHMQDVQRGH